MMDFDKELADALSALAGEFQPNELAYLATTTKVEAPFRDRLGFLLHQTYEPIGRIVAREWNRVDLAVLDSAGSPLGLVELKAMYTFDAIRNLDFFTSATSADEIKAQRLAEARTAVYSLLLVTHPSESVRACFMKPVKYSGYINRAILDHGDGATLRIKAAAKIEESLLGRSVVARGEVSGGSAFGLGVTVLYWLIRNDRKNLLPTVGFQASVAE